MENKEEKKNNNSGLYIIICSILVIGAIIIGAYFYFLGDNKKVFVSALNNMYNNLNDSISDIEKKIPITDKDTFLIHSKMNIESEEENLQMIKDYNLTLDFGADYNNNQYTLKALLANKDDQEILSALLNYNNQNIYLSSEDLFSKVIAITNSDIKDELEIPTLNIDYYTFARNNLTIVKKTLSDFISSKDIKTTKETLTINNKPEEVTTYTLSLDKERLDDLFKKLQTNISNDKDIVSFLATLLNISEEEVKNNLLEESSFLDNVKISVYRKGILDTFVGAKITINDETITYYDVDNYEELSSKDASIIRNDNITTIDLTKEDNTLKKVTIENTDKDKYIITLDIEDLKPVKINLELSVTYDVKLDLLDYKNSISIDDLTEEDQNEIVSNLIKTLSSLVTF